MYAVVVRSETGSLPFAPFAPFRFHVRTDVHAKAWVSRVATTLCLLYTNSSRTARVFLCCCVLRVLPCWPVSYGESTSSPACPCSTQINLCEDSRALCYVRYVVSYDTSDCHWCSLSTIHSVKLHKQASNKNAIGETKRTRICERVCSIHSIDMLC